MAKVWEMVYLFSCMALKITNELSYELVCVHVAMYLHSLEVYKLVLIKL